MKFTAVEYAKLDVRFWNKVQKTDSCWLWTAAKDKHGYGKFNFQNENVMAHRIAWFLVNGEMPTDTLDHECRNPSCIRPGGKHLRLASMKQQAENRPVRKDSASGIRGVTWDARSKKWRAYVMHNGKTIHLGRFKGIEAAEAAVVAKRNELFTHNVLDRKAL